MTFCFVKFSMYTIASTMENNFENVVLRNSCTEKRDKETLHGLHFSANHIAGTIQEDETACFHIISTKNLSTS